MQESVRVSRRAPGLYYGWIVAIALALLASANNGGSYAFGIYFGSISQQFGIDRAALSLTVTINRFLAGLLQPVAGYLADRYGPRQVGVAGAIILGTGLAILSFARTLPAIYVAYGLIAGIGMAAMAGGISAKVMGAWFIRRRGVAMSLAGGGTIIAQILIVPAATFILVKTNWQTADRIVAALVLLIIVPVAWVLIRNHPKELKLQPDGEPTLAVAAVGGQPTSAISDTVGLSLRQAMRFPAFWQLAVGLIACGVTMSFPSTHLMAFTTDMGMSDMTASETIGIAGLLSLPGSVGLGYLGDRFGRDRMLATAYALRAITYITLLQAHHPAIMFAAGIALGLSWGATVPLTAAIVADLFGRKAIATIVNTMTMLMFLASGSFVYLAGLDYDRLGSYDLSLAFAVLMGVSACVCCWRIRMPEGAQSFTQTGALPVYH